MTSKISSFVALFLLPAMSLTAELAIAQETCVTSGATLSQARNNYANQCDLERVDCDPFNGTWVCASFNMTSSTPPALTVTSTPTTPAPSTPPQVATTPANPVTASLPSCRSTASDSDGDGFGWENNNTCLVTSNTPDPAPDNSNPPPASGTSSASTSSGNTARRDCSSAASDPDGDGYGWENGATCLATSANVTQPSQPVGTAAASAITDLILVTGQSNALGAGTDYDTSLDAPDSKVFAFTNNGWQVANLNQVWDLNWHPRNHPDTDPSNNFSLHFGKNVAAKDSSRVIGFVLVTAPGAKIENWQTGGSFYAQMQAKVLDAINQLPHKSSIDGVLWHQGESDGEDKQYYSDALYQLINNLRSEPWVASNAPFICGETKIPSVNKRLNSLNRDSDPTTACVQGADLPTLGDNRHFSAEALRTIGARYADAYLNIVN